MHNIDPNEMDALFREGADNHEFSYNPEAWALMEEKLDSRNRRKYLLWVFLGALVIAGTIGVFSYLKLNNSQSLVANNAKVEIASYEKINTPQTEKTSSTNNQTIIESSKISSDNTTIKGDNSIGNNQKINNNDIVQSNTAQTEKEYINTVSKVRSRNIGAQNSFQSENTGSLVDNEVVSVSSPSVSNSSTTTNNTPTTSNSVNQNQKSSNELIDIPFVEGLGISPFNIESKNLDFIGLEINAFTPTVGKVLPAVNRFAFTAFANSEFSSVGFLKSQTAGWKVGVKFGYQFADKFQLDLGLAFSHKKYGSEGSEYNKSDGWEKDIMPMWMDAKCNVIEIPLEMSYYFNGYQKDGFFVNAGISSYFLNSEWYGFMYDPSVDLLVNPGIVQEINPEDVEMNYHLSGVGKLSFGYQKIISPKMALEVSPYLQIPLTGIGEGKVNLYTVGVQFAAKFNTK